jgi:hypothetical protein
MTRLLSGHTTEMGRLLFGPRAVSDWYVARYKLELGRCDEIRVATRITRGYSFPPARPAYQLGRSQTRRGAHSSIDPLSNARSLVHVSQLTIDRAQSVLEALTTQAA